MRAIRASLLHCLADPGEASNASAWEFIEDGILLIEAGRIVGAGAAVAMLERMPGGIDLTDYRGKLVVPGFIDCHVHFPQLDIIGSYGEQLLDCRHMAPLARHPATSGTQQSTRTHT